MHRSATLLDFNGVLVDDENVHLDAFRAVLQPLGLQVSDEDYLERYLGFDDVGAFAAILTDAGRSPDPALVARLVEEKRPEYERRARASLRTFPGAADLVRRRAARGPVGIVSGALRSEIELGLGVLGVRGEVSFVISAEDTRRCKPDPEGYLLGIEALARRVGEGAARHALVVEDSVAGVEAARAAGLPCIAVTHSYPAARLHAAGASAVVTTLDAVDDALVEGRR